MYLCFCFVLAFDWRWVNGWLFRIGFGFCFGFYLHLALEISQVCQWEGLDLDVKWH